MSRAASAAPVSRESENHLATYLRSIKQTPPLEREEEIALAKQIQEGAHHLRHRDDLRTLDLLQPFRCIRFPAHHATESSDDSD